MINTRLSKRAKRNFLAAFIAPLLLSTSIASQAAENVPSHTYFQARKMVQSTFPDAQNLAITRYQSDSINGVVGKVLNASTVIDFDTNGKRERVIMLPDGEHLILGNIIKAGDKQPLATPTQPAKLAQLQGKQAREALDEIEENHNSPYTAKLPQLQIDYSNGLDTLVKERRMKSSDLTPVFEGAAKTPEEFMATVEQLPSIQLGDGKHHIYIFADPNCSNCRLEYQSAKKHQGDAVFHWIPIYALTTSPTYKQVALSQPDTAVNTQNLDLLMENPNMKDGIVFEANDEAAMRLHQTQKAFYNLRDRRTPVTLYRSADGSPTVIHGYNPKLIASIIRDMKSKD
ncbi:hypothetical protein [Neptuniibacter halophilus]|uniref:hypothetical protein n=1 Tax=Neptuniibacter halophilus TaxID=651666 RepID=UPI0025739BB1|nr:hypothetical protein [Neptuniibacter halophilus]